mgnify:CR=1 FL=1
MHPQLELLIMLQDIDTLLRESKNDKQRKELSNLGFPIAEPAADLEDARRRITRRIEKEILTKYERLMHRYGHAIAPAVDEICYGCFMRMPTSFALGKDKNEEINSCPNCERYLYWLGK